jgi:nucleoside-diphosphate-sugar epimerase
VAAVKALITGSAGFLGRHFAARLRADGHDVEGIDNAEPGGFDALDVFRYGQHRHYDLVLHLAAVSPHRAAIDGRALAVGAGNLALDAAMFDWAGHARPGRVVYFSSSAAYPVDLQDDFARPHDLCEDDIRLNRLNVGTPDAIYGWVKLTGERLADAYRSTGGAVTVVRPFSGYGEDQSANFPFGAFRDRALGGEAPFTIWGTGEQVRDWIHVDDIVHAVLAAVEQDVDGPLNLCTGIGTSLRELAKMFTAAAGYRPAFELHPDKPAGVAYRVGDPTRMHQIYTPKVSIEEGVKRALEAS